MRRHFELLKRFKQDERGVFAVFFALLAMVLIATSGAVVDFTSVQTMRTRAQTALDSAALALQPTIGNTGVTATTLKAQAQTILTQQLNNSTVTATVTSAVPDTTAGTLTLNAHLSVPTAFVQLVGVSTLEANLVSEVTQGSKDLEVAAVLDTTGSMAGSKITALKDATDNLIDDVVKTVQTPTYSKMAIVPFSAGVDVGSSYASNVRGTATGGKTITSLTWSTGTPRNISSITRANPGVITITSGSGVSGLANNDWVYISGVSGMTQINGKIGQIANLNTSSRTFNLKVGGTNLCTTSGCGYSSATSNTGTVTKCLLASCVEMVTTSSAHGLATNDKVYITGTSGTTGINTQLNAILSVTSISSTTYSLNGTSPSNGTASGGTSYCVVYGCTYYYFNYGGWDYVWQANNCVTERSTNAYTDAAPSTTALKFNYTSGGAACGSQTIQPLTSNKTTLHNLVTTLSAAGSTAGHLGLAWGWYMVAPNFGYLWPSSSRPAAYGTANLIKAVILMTDGAFNTEYCNGVTSPYACTQANNSQTQAEALCDAIKTPANHIVLYTVGFQLGTDTNALNFLRDCASSTTDFYQAETSADLINAFGDIAQNLNELRVSK